MRLDDEAYEEVKAEVANCIKQCRLKYPFSARDLAKILGIKLVPYRFLKSEEVALAMITSKDAFLLEAGFHAIIFFNDEILQERQEMSIFHEIGHFILEHNHDKTKSDEKKEAEAGFFAKYIMAPTVLVDLLPEKSSEAIEKIFKVSHQAANIMQSNYRSWKGRFHGIYTDYEKTILAHGREGILGLIGNLMKEVG